MRQRKKRGTAGMGAVFAAGIAVGWLPGCGNDSTAPAPVDPQQAIAAGAQAAQVAQLATNESMLDAVEQPFTSAAGDLDGLGEVGLGNDTLGDLGGAAVLAQATAALGPALRLAEGTRSLSLAALEKTTAGNRVAAPECNPLPASACASANICTEATGEPDVVTVTIEKTACEGAVARSQQRFVVDTRGTLVREDDEIRSYASLVQLDTGTEIEVTMEPVTGTAIVDGSHVDMTETIRHPVGPVDTQTNAIEMDVGLVRVDGDEVIWSLMSQVEYRNGARARAEATEVLDGGVANGITDGDRVRVTRQFTAAPANTRLESASTVVEVLVGTLNDPADDRYASAQHTVVFDGRTVLGDLPTATALFVPATPVLEGEEPCGGTLTQTATFPAGWEATSFQHTVSRSCDNGGRSDLQIGFDDGTTLVRTIEWTAAGAATLDLQARDGTVTHGSWTTAGATAVFVVDTTFPAGNDPISVYQEGTSDRAAGTRAYARVVTFADEHQETLAVQAQRQADGTRTLTATQTRPVGTTAFTLEWDPQTRVLSGTAHGPQDESGSFTLVRLEDGSILLQFAWSDPSAAVSVEGSVTVGPDGKGCGELTVSQYGGASRYWFCFTAGGRGVIGGSQPLPF